ncbi:MAG: hypothetical protein JO180_05890, partial [Gemmatirosa sp.]|nr:hypothetical protein [Gemmatirosa sp.]
AGAGKGGRSILNPPNASGVITVAPGATPGTAVVRGVATKDVVGQASGPDAAGDYELTSGTLQSSFADALRVFIASHQRGPDAANRPQRFFFQ